MFFTLGKFYFVDLAFWHHCRTVLAIVSNDVCATVWDIYWRKLQRETYKHLIKNTDSRF